MLVSFIVPCPSSHEAAQPSTSTGPPTSPSMSGCDSLRSHHMTEPDGPLLHPGRSKRDTSDRGTEQNSIRAMRKAQPRQTPPVANRLARTAERAVHAQAPGRTQPAPTISGGAYPTRPTHKSRHDRHVSPLRLCHLMRLSGATQPLGGLFHERTPVRGIIPMNLVCISTHLRQTRELLVLGDGCEIGAPVRLWEPSPALSLPCSTHRAPAGYTPGFPCGPSLGHR
jgi:hypothetical protein